MELFVFVEIIKMKILVKYFEKCNIFIKLKNLQIEMYLNFVIGNFKVLKFIFIKVKY